MQLIIGLYWVYLYVAKYMTWLPATAAIVACAALAAAGAATVLNRSKLRVRTSIVNDGLCSS